MVITIIVFLLQNHSFHPYGRCQAVTSPAGQSKYIKERFGPWTRMLERAGTRPVAQSYLDRRRRRKEKRERHKEYRRQIREQQAAEAAQAEETVQVTAVE